jgi:pimeloyl-ACP methyl ester carboxylesterase
LSQDYRLASIILPKLKKGTFNFLKIAIDCFFLKVYFSLDIETSRGTCTESGERGKFSCADIQKFNFPILLLNGERSPKLYEEMIAVMRQCKPDIPAPLIVPKATHTMHRDNPEFFNKAVLDFLNQH